tara:strand:- start:3928 stop:5019 length:1092 start_codon:yes stop_codon:yes gene_type:complete
MDKYDIINKLIKLYNYKSFLQVKGEDISDKITLDITCYKNSVPRAAFDLIYLGEKDSDLLYTDINNALEVLTHTGVIIVPFINPKSASVQRDYDSWRAWVKKRTYDFQILQVALDVDNGVGLIFKGSQVPWERPGSDCYNYYYLDFHREPLLNLVNAENYFKPVVANRVDIINSIINYVGATNYLEIGLYEGACFSQINAPNKVSVDPEKLTDLLTHQMTSDEFFEQNTGIFDVVFIDGLHHSDQVYKDIKNSIDCLSDKGVVICHDMNPPTKERQEVPCVKWPWNGDCWKAWVKLRVEEPNLNMFVIDADEGCGIITKGSQRTLNLNLTEDYGYGLTWEDLDSNRMEYLNLISLEKFSKLYV